MTRNNSKILIHDNAAAYRRKKIWEWHQKYHQALEELHGNAMFDNENRLIIELNIPLAN